MRLATRTFLSTFLPLAALLVGSFWALRLSVMDAVREDLRHSVRQNQLALQTNGCATGFRRLRAPAFLPRTLPLKPARAVAHRTAGSCGRLGERWRTAHRDCYFAKLRHPGCVGSGWPAARGHQKSREHYPPSGSGSLQHSQRLFAEDGREQPRPPDPSTRTTRIWVSDGGERVRFGPGSVRRWFSRGTDALWMPARADRPAQLWRSRLRGAPAGPSARFRPMEQPIFPAGEFIERRRLYAQNITKRRCGGADEHGDLEGLCQRRLVALAAALGISLDRSGFHRPAHRHDGAAPERH